jgi:hypothetical protein
MQIQLDHSPTGAFKTVRQDTLTNRRGHSGMLQKFVGSGSVRLQWPDQSDGVQPYGDVAGGNPSRDSVYDACGRTSRGPGQAWRSSLAKGMCS